MSPEVYNGSKYGFKSDIWSFGCCIFELCNQKNAFEGSVRLKNIVTNIYLVLECSCS